MDRLKDECEDTDWDSAPAVGDLNSYYLAVCARAPQLVFVLVARGRLLLKPDLCEHIAIFWRRFCFWLKITPEIELFLLAVLTLFQWLQPVLEQMIDLEGYIE